MVAIVPAQAHCDGQLHDYMRSLLEIHPTSSPPMPPIKHKDSIK